MRKQSPTLVIEGVSGELAPETKTTKARIVEEEEGSSSHPEKEDNEEGNVVDED